MSAIDFGSGPNTATGDTVAQALAKLQARLDALAAPGPTPTLSLSSAVTQAEGNSGTSTFAWTLTLTRNASTAAFPFSWAVTGNGSSPADAADFGGTLPSGSGTFAAGETSKTITVLVAGDTAVEPAETFLLTVTAAGLNTVTSIGTISNDDTSSAINVLTLEGDSLTYLGGEQNGFSDSYGRKYIAYRTDKTVTQDAAVSRVVRFKENDGGGNPTFYVDGDGQNSAISNLTADTTTVGAQLVTGLFGSNDMSVARTAAQFRTDLAAYKAALNGKGAKFSFSPPPPYNAFANPQHGQYVNFTAQRDAFLSTWRDPSVWSTLCDYPSMMGLHPAFSDATTGPLCYDDNGNGTVHLSTYGHARLFECFKAHLDSLLDASRASATTMYGSAWIASETNLATSTTLVRKIVVSGLAPGGTALGASVAGGGAQIRVAGGAWSTSVGTGAGNGYRIYNDDILELQLTTSANNATAVSCDLTIGSETRTLTYTTVAQVTPAAYVHGGIVGDDTYGATHSFAGLNFASTGVAIVALENTAQASGVTVGGVAATRRALSAPYDTLEVWTAPVTSTGAKTIAVTYASARDLATISWGVVTDADPTPVQVSQRTAPAGQPYLTDALTVPASGIAIGFMGLYSAPVGTVTGSGNTQVDAGLGSSKNGEYFGFVVGKRTTSGTIAFNQGNYNDKAVAALVFKASGT